MNSDNLCGEVTAAAETHNSEETKWECYCITFTTPPRSSGLMKPLMLANENPNMTFTIQCMYMYHKSYESFP